MPITRDTMKATSIGLEKTSKEEGLQRPIDVVFDWINASQYLIANKSQSTIFYHPSQVK